MNEKEYIGYCEKEVTRLEARRYQFMGMEWDDLNKADHTKLLEIGNRVMNEDNTVTSFLCALQSQQTPPRIYSENTFEIKKNADKSTFFLYIS